MRLYGEATQFESLDLLGSGLCGAPETLLKALLPGASVQIKGESSSVRGFSLACANIFPLAIQ
jgi:hypothetical protein